VSLFLHADGRGAACIWVMQTQNGRTKRTKWTLSNVGFMNSVFTVTEVGRYRRSLLYHSPRRQENAGIATFITEIGEKDNNH